MLIYLKLCAGFFPSDLWFSRERSLSDSIQFSGFWEGILRQLDREGQDDLQDCPAMILQSQVVSSQENKSQVQPWTISLCTCPILFTLEIEVPKKSHFLKERDIKKSVSNTFSPEAQNRRYHKYTLGFSGWSFPKNDSPLISTIKLSDKIHELKSANLRLLFELLHGRYSLGVKVTKWRSIIIQ